LVWRRRQCYKALINRQQIKMRLNISWRAAAAPSIALLLSMSTIFTIDRGWAATATARDGGTIQVGNVIYRLDGIDAPELDQTCIDDHADPWACGLEARDRLSALIGGREVRCETSGTKPSDKKRRLGLCTVVGESRNLNQLMVREGFGLMSDPAGNNRLKEEQATAKDKRQGLWKGCFVAPQEFRRGRKGGPLLGEACRVDKDREIRAVLFPSDNPMPPGCSIKGKFAVRARVTGDIGVYHLQGCRSYPGLTKPDRWFCSEEDAQAAGFRKAYNCRATNARRS
jgi:endonuclease YncB( thermonuclease family)